MRGKPGKGRARSEKEHGRSESRTYCSLGMEDKRESREGSEGSSYLVERERGEGDWESSNNGDNLSEGDAGGEDLILHSAQVL